MPVCLLFQSTFAVLIRSEHLFYSPTSTPAPRTPPLTALAALAALRTPAESSAAAAIPVPSSPSNSLTSAIASSFSPASGESWLQGMNVVERLWNKAKEHARLLLRSQRPNATLPPPDAFLQNAYLQKDATFMAEEHARKQFLESASPYQRVLQTACSAPQASIFLTTLPTQPCYTLDNESMRLAIRHRMGVPSSDSLLSRSCFCGNHASTDPDHFHSCTFTRGSSLTQRHDHLVNALADLAQKFCEFVVTREPNDHLRPAEIEAEAEKRSLLAEQGDFTLELPEHHNRHGDLLLVRHDKKLYIDVSVLRIRPTNASTLKSLTSAQTVPLVATRTREKQKHLKYNLICETNEYKMIPFVLESYGGIGVEGHALLQSLSQHSHSMSPAAFLRHAHRTLSVCLQRGNATISLLGQQRLHLKRQKQRLQETRAFAGIRFSHRPAEQVNNAVLRRRLSPSLDADDAFSFSHHAARVNSDSAAFIHPPLLRADLPAPGISIPASTTIQLERGLVSRASLSRGGWEQGEEEDSDD